MKITDVFSLLGGLALFLYGMQMMSNGLEAAGGKQDEADSGKADFKSFFRCGGGRRHHSGVIQSSSATTVMVVGFVNSGMMTLRQAVWIIMGANIGTTITGQLIALDIGAIAPLIAFAGVALIMFVKKQKVHDFALIIAGLGILFIGMEMMSSAMMPFARVGRICLPDDQILQPGSWHSGGYGFLQPLIQSSSASVGILQALATSGLIGLSNAVFVLFGQNIGTCITAVLASIGANRNAKRTTIIHLMFNIIGTAIFTTVCILSPLTSLVESWDTG